MEWIGTTETRLSPNINLFRQPEENVFSNEFGEDEKKISEEV